MNFTEIVRDAIPAKHFASPPYQAVKYNESKDLKHTVAGVENRNGINVLTFNSKPGAVLTTIELAEAIAAAWNAEAA